MNYRMLPISGQFIREHHYLSAIMGPAGSFKTVSSMIKILLLSSCIMPCKDRLRRSRWGVFRNTRQEMENTTKRLFLESFPINMNGDVGILQFNDVYIEFVFIALDDPKSINVLLNSEFTCAYFNELREIDESVWNTVEQRIGRFPSLHGNGTNPVFDKAKALELGIVHSGEDLYCMFADTLPPKIDSDYYDMFEKQKNFKIYKLPSGISPQAESVADLPDDYYQKIIDSNIDNDLIGALVYGRYY